MNLKEAYTTLELAEGTSPEEAKKQYRKLTKEFHPDVNKDPDAEAKFKKINEAYECIKNGKGNERQPPARPSGNPFHRQQAVQLENVEMHVTVSFKESVLGCKREVKYSRYAKCSTCDGAGEVRLNNGCAKCGGKGQTVLKKGGMIFMATCPHCAGRTTAEECKACSGQCVVKTDVSVHVSIPAGVIDLNILRLQGMGHYVGSTTGFGAMMGLGDQYMDAFCHVAVTPEAGLSIEGKSVVSTLNISLLDAIRGCKRSVKTIFGQSDITIKPQSRNRDEVIIPHCGVGGAGDQKVILDVQYPTNVDKLVGILTNEVN
jgi:molecular chaperone DnaJ